MEVQRTFRLPLIVALAVVIILHLWPASWRNSLDDWSYDMLHRLRGGRTLSDDLVLVTIGADDIAALGGWPLTRDYYGYLLQGLTRMGARVVAPDLLFEQRDRLYPEFDAIFSDYIAGSHRVILPMAFSGIKAAPLDRVTPDLPTQVQEGVGAVMPADLFRTAAASVGFSNVSDEPVIRRVPAMLFSGDSIVFSYGVQMARLYLGARLAAERGNLRFRGSDGTDRRVPLDDRGFLMLDHFGGVEQVRTIGLIEALRQIRRGRDDLPVRDKIVLIAAVSPGLPVLKATPLAEVLPGALLHATVAENIIHRRVLRPVGRMFTLFVLILAALVPVVLLQCRARRLLVVLCGAWLLILPATSLLLFAADHLFLPFALPLIASGCSMIAASLALLVDSRRRLHEEKHRLHREISMIESERTAVRSQLSALEKQLQQQERENRTLAGQTQVLIEEKQLAMARLDEHLEELQPAALGRGSAEEEWGLIHASGGAMERVVDLVRRIGPEDLPVLLLGETGTGKEVVARALHAASKRSAKPFVAINCSALTETLLESELFGHEKGSFTGALTRRRGHFEMADGGTLFLDEISETSGAFQAKLLRVLQEGLVQRLGSEGTIRVDVRIIAASNRDVKASVDVGAFRADLYYRLNGVTITLPALRERTADIPLLAEHFLRQRGQRTIGGISTGAMRRLIEYHWPGNVRELENAVRHAAVLAASEDRSLIQSCDWPEDIRSGRSGAVVGESYQPLEQQILAHLRSHRFNHSALSQTARDLGHRDRGTITEYFRGLCFEALVANQFVVRSACRDLAGDEDARTVARVEQKLRGYVQNLPQGEVDPAASAVFKGLPKKYHPALRQVIAHLDEIR